ncbi:MAG: hypothetical protein DI535_15745 [Citrobacter freundii]|nr:MAG: hypothetical protein DI535_15745 [Citrobacter freundii]
MRLFFKRAAHDQHVQPINGNLSFPLAYRSALVREYPVNSGTVSPHHNHPIPFSALRSAGTLADGSNIQSLKFVK